MDNFAAKFRSDLKVGQSGEALIAQMLKVVWGAVSVDYNNTNTHDISFNFRDGLVKTVECKVDLLALARYPNCFLEVYCSGKPSGLNVTTAGTYAIYIPHSQELFLFCPQKMLRYLSSSLGAKHRVASGGDAGRATGHLIPVSVLRELPFVEIIPQNHK